MYISTSCRQMRHCNTLHASTSAKQTKKDRVNAKKKRVTCPEVPNNPNATGRADYARFDAASELDVMLAPGAKSELLAPRPSPSQLAHPRRL